MGSDEGAPVYTSGKLCAFPFQLESGGNMVHLHILEVELAPAVRTVAAHLVIDGPAFLLGQSSSLWQSSIPSSGS